MKKVCFFNTEKNWGGGEKWHLETAIELNEMNYQILVYGNNNSELIKKSKENHLKTDEIEISNLSFLNIFKIIKVYKILKKHNVDTIILNLPRDLKMIGIVTNFLKIENVIYRRGSAIPIKNTFLNKYLLKNKVDRILANSEETKKTIMENIKDQNIEKKIFVIRNYFDEQQFLIDNNEIVNITKDNNNQIIIGNLGRISKQKRQEDFIEIAKILLNKNIDFKIYIAGKGEEERNLIEKIENENLQEKIKLLGFVTNTKEFMEKIDMFILTSEWEGFGYVLVEAMYTNKPIIAYNISSNPETLENYKCKALVDFKNYDKIVDEILNLNHIKQNTQNCKEGKNLVEKKYSKTEIFKEIEAII